MESDFIYGGIGKRRDRTRLKKGTIPTCFLWSKEMELRPNPKDKARQAKEEQNKNNIQEERQGMGNSSSVFDEKCFKTRN